MPKEVGSYVEHHLKLADVSTPLFTASAFEAIAARSSCLPRVIKQHHLPRTHLRRRQQPQIP